MRLWFAAIGAALVATAAGAQTSTVFAARPGSETAGLEQQLLVQREDTPDGASARLSLANLYMRTSRPALAADLYREVLAKDNQMMRTADGSLAWSHDLARRALHPPRAVALR